MLASATNSIHEDHNGTSKEINTFLIGWRKKCLYLVVGVLMIITVVNLGLTIWILKVMEFSSNGMGNLKIVNGGIELTGQTFVEQLRVSKLQSKLGQPISIESSRNFSINTRDTDGMIENQLFLGHDKLNITSNIFQIRDINEEILFSVDREDVTIGSNSLRVDGEGGAIFRESIQTSNVRAAATKGLKLESPTRSLEMTASQEMFIQSRAGNIEASSLNDIKLHSIKGNIRLDALNIMMPDLQVAAPYPNKTKSAQKIYQLCICSNGKLFIAEPDNICDGDEKILCK